MAPNRKRPIGKNVPNEGEASPPKKRRLSRKDSSSGPTIIETRQLNSRVLITEGPSDSDRISSLGSDQDAGGWDGERVNESQIQSTLPETPLITNLISGPEKIARIVKDMIPGIYWKKYVN